MIFDHIEWDEYNLDHATKRLTAAEIEQAIRNADGRNMYLSKDAPDRRLIRSATDGGKRVAVVIELVSNGARQSRDGQSDHGQEADVGSRARRLLQPHWRPVRV